MKSARRTARAHVTQALLLRRVDLGEADLVLHFLTETTGRIAAVARAARKSQKRFGGALEPFHTLRVQLEERHGSELMTLGEAAIATARSRVVSNLDRMQAAGRVLAWVRRATPPHVREAAIWSSIVSFLDVLESGGTDLCIDTEVAKTGLQLLTACGWGLELEQCVVCAKRCDSDRTAFVDAARGGLVCRACGGTGTRLGGAQRARFRAATSGAAQSLRQADTALALSVVEAALRAHLGFE